MQPSVLKACKRSSGDELSSTPRVLRSESLFKMRFISFSMSAAFRVRSAAFLASSGAGVASGVIIPVAGVGPSLLLEGSTGWLDSVAALAMLTWLFLVSGNRKALSEDDYCV